ncbi:uncharacterized protein LOC126576760 [Anopheles aquasalis]|uniref:uncharacterized protein LOC126576760 n=1 Tax=Anopheles aquasalis TaxID=42839 RepID=UPI00215A5E00|nr:uncharacterized protein LOC126576760 [Anopheles aquasalis]
MQQGSCDDSDRMSQDNVSNGSEERFLSEVQKATSTHTPGRATVRRATPVNRQPPPCTSSTRVQQFIFKLNSIILSDIEERADEDGGNIVRQLERNPEKVVELLSHSASLGDADGLMDEGREPDARKRSQKSNSKQAKAGARLRRQQSVAVEDNDINPPVTLANGEPDVTQSNEGNSAPPTATFAGIVQLQDIPPAVRLRALMRFKSLDSFRTETEHDNGGSDGVRRGRAVYGTCQPKSLDAIDDLEEAEELSSSVEVSYDAEEEERICGELLTELRALEEADRAEALESNATPNENETSTNAPDDDGDDGEIHKTAWEKLQDYLQRVPKRRDSEYDLFCGNEEDVLKMLFKRQKIKLLFHFSDSSSSSTDTL